MKKLFLILIINLLSGLIYAQNYTILRGNVKQERNNQVNFIELNDSVIFKSSLPYAFYNPVNIIKNNPTVDYFMKIENSAFNYNQPFISLINSIRQLYGNTNINYDLINFKNQLNLNHNDTTGNITLIDNRLFNGNCNIGNKSAGRDVIMINNYFENQSILDNKYYGIKNYFTQSIGGSNVLGQAYGIYNEFNINTPCNSAFGLYLNEVNVSGVSNKYGIYQNGSSPNRLGGTLTVIDDTIGNAYPVLKRNASPTNTGLFIWNSAIKRAVTDANLTWNASILAINGGKALNIKDATNADTYSISDDGTKTNISSTNPIAWNYPTLYNTPKYQFASDINNSYSLTLARNNADIIIANFNNTSAYTSLRFANRASGAASSVIISKYISSTNSDLILSNGMSDNQESFVLRSTGDITMYGNIARTLSIDRHTTTNSTGSNLLINSGGATSGATDKNGGMITIAPGLSTGTGFSSVRLQRNSRNASTSTSDNSLNDAIIVFSEKNLTNNDSVPLFEVSLATLQGGGGMYIYTCFVSNGVDLQTHTGHVHLAFVNKAGMRTVQIVDEGPTDDADANSSGTLTDGWGYATGTNKIIIKAIFSSSLTPTSMKLYGTYFNNSMLNITQL